MASRAYLFVALSLPGNEGLKIKAGRFAGPKDVALVGTNDFTSFTHVLDVPVNATEIFVGGNLTGEGAAWFANITIECRSISAARRSTTPSS